MTERILPRCRVCGGTGQLRKVIPAWFPYVESLEWSDHQCPICKGTGNMHICCTMCGLEVEMVNNRMVCPGGCDADTQPRHKPQGIFIRCERCYHWQKREQFGPWPPGWADIKDEILCPSCAQAEQEKEK